MWRFIDVGVGVDANVDMDEDVDVDTDVDKDLEFSEMRRLRQLLLGGRKIFHTPEHKSL